MPGFQRLNCTAVVAINVHTQTGVSSQHISTLSMKDSIANTSPSSMLAVYKALQVAVYTVDKTEVNLTRQDLVELVNVGSLSFSSYFNCVALISHKSAKFCFSQTCPVLYAFCPNFVLRNKDAKSLHVCYQMRFQARNAPKMFFFGRGTPLRAPIFLKK